MADVVCGHFTDCIQQAQERMAEVLQLIEGAEADLFEDTPDWLEAGRVIKDVETLQGYLDKWMAGEHGGERNPHRALPDEPEENPEGYEWNDVTDLIYAYIKNDKEWLEDVEGWYDEASTEVAEKYSESSPSMLDPQHAIEIKVGRRIKDNIEENDPLNRNVDALYADLVETALEDVEWAKLAGGIIEDF